MTDTCVLDGTQVQERYVFIQKCFLDQKMSNMISFIKCCDEMSFANRKIVIEIKIILRVTSKGYDINIRMIIYSR